MSRRRWVIKISGTPLEDPAVHVPLWRTLQELRSSGCEIVLVHGGGRALDGHLERLGMETRRVGGLRCTPDEQMLEVAAVLAGRVNKLLVSTLTQLGASAVGLSLLDGGEILAKRISLGDADLGRVGEISGGNVALLELLLDGGYLPVLASIACDADGLLNVNADDAGAGLASLLGCDGVAFLSDVEGVRGEEGTILPELHTGECERLIESGVIKGGMIAKVRAASRCAMGTGKPAIIASYLQPESLAELLAGRARGTRIVADLVETPNHAGGGL